jgi:hypothetical protein
VSADAAADAAAAVSERSGLRACGTCWFAGVLFLSLSVMSKTCPIPANTPRRACAGTSFIRSLTCGTRILALSLTGGGSVSARQASRHFPGASLLVSG